MVADGNAPQPRSSSLRTIVFFSYAIVAVVLVFTTDRSLENKTGLPLVNQVGSWIILVSGTLLVISQTESDASTLITNLFLGVGGPYILMSISYAQRKGVSSCLETDKSPY